MKIFRAIGLGLAILILQATMSEVFNAFENTAISFFDASEAIFDSVESNLGSTIKIE